MIGEVLTEKDFKDKLRAIESRIVELKADLKANHYLIAKLEFDARRLRDSLKMAGGR